MVHTSVVFPKPQLLQFPPMTARRLALPLAAVAALSLAACGGGSSNAAPPTDADVVVDALDGNKFDAAAYTATAGAVKLAYVSKSSIAHTLVVLGSDGVTVGSKLKLSAGKTEVGAYTLPAGTYQLICDVPGHDNMKATLTVN